MYCFILMKYFFGLDKWNILVQFYKYLILKSKEITDKIVTNCGFYYNQPNNA